MLYLLFSLHKLLFGMNIETEEGQVYEKYYKWYNDNFINAKEYRQLSSSQLDSIINEL